VLIAACGPAPGLRQAERDEHSDHAGVFGGLEPALFLISPDRNVYYESILSMPVGRPRLDDLLGGIDFWTTNDYPARGDA